MDENRAYEKLLDWHLHQLAEEERQALESELLRNGSLRAQSDRVGQVLRPLDYWTAASAPPHLPDKILASLRRTSDRSPTASSSTVPLSASPPASYRTFPSVSLREVLAVAACLLLLVGVGVPTLSRFRARSRQALCANNLGTIFQGVTLYQAAFGGSLPYAGAVPHAKWLPRSRAAGPYASNSRHVFLLTKLHFGPSPANFVCPSSPSAEPMAEDRLATCTDFARARNIRYASLNLAGDAPHLKPRRTMAYMSDLNPLFVEGRFHPALDPDNTNSPAHHGKGQAVLLLDGNVIQLTKPIYGPRHDNLWLAGRVRSYTGTETAPHGDAFLINGFPAAELGSR